MVDGTYNVTLKIPFGALKGVVTLTTAEDGVCSASLTLQGQTQQAEGTASGDSFSFAGEADTPLGAMSYQITGTADGQTIDATAKTKVGNLKVTGSRA